MKILELTLPRLEQLFKTEYGKGRYHAEALYREVFKHGNLAPLSAVEFQKSPVLTEKLESRLKISTGRIVDTLSEDRLLKFITRFEDGLEVESVIIPMTRYDTLCVSCQVGCRMGCRFCETGNMGFRRNLSCEEIVGQVFNARHVLNRAVKNVVFMGMGEPFDNFDNVIQAIRVMQEQRGFDIAFRHITISTAGLIDGIQRLSALDLPGIKLAVSINAPSNEKRSALMPVNQKNSLENIKTALSRYPLSRRGTFLFEYILIKGINDSREDARELGQYIKPLKVRLNLIAHNPVAGFHCESVTEEDMHRFADWLREDDIFVIKRWGKGSSVTAGCGQLARKECPVRINPSGHSV